MTVYMECSECNQPWPMCECPTTLELLSDLLDDE